MYDCCVYLPVVGSSSKDLLTPFSCAHSLLSVYGSPYHKKYGSTFRVAQQQIAVVVVVSGYGFYKLLRIVVICTHT